MPSPGRASLGPERYQPRCRGSGGQSGRHIHLVLENDDNRAVLLDPSSDIPDGKYRAQWNDDYHHVWHVILTEETHGYYGDYATQPRRLLARTLRAGFAYQGEPSAHRGGGLAGNGSARYRPPLS